MCPKIIHSIKVDRVPRLWLALQYFLPYPQWWWLKMFLKFYQSVWEYINVVKIFFLAYRILWVKWSQQVNVASYTEYVATVIVVIYKQSIPPLKKDPKHPSPSQPPPSEPLHMSSSKSIPSQNTAHLMSHEMLHDKITTKSLEYSTSTHEMTPAQLRQSL